MKMNLIHDINIVNIFYLLSASLQGNNSHFTELPMYICKIFMYYKNITNCLRRPTHYNLNKLFLWQLFDYS